MVADDEDCPAEDLDDATVAQVVVSDSLEEEPEPVTSPKRSAKLSKGSPKASSGK